MLYLPLSPTVCVFVCLPACSLRLDPSVSQYDFGGDFADSHASLVPNYIVCLCVVVFAADLWTLL
jgi:hypothetical protein